VRQAEPAADEAAVAEQLDRRWIAGEAVEEYLRAGVYRFEEFSQNPMLF